jgi:hypothetical protein
MFERALELVLAPQGKPSARRRPARSPETTRTVEAVAQREAMGDCGPMSSAVVHAIRWDRGKGDRGREAASVA